MGQAGWHDTAIMGLCVTSEASKEQNERRRIEMPAKEKTYKCLNPVGIHEPVETFPLAPRLDTLKGKEIWFSICGEPDITIALEKKIKMDYPDVNWRIKKTYSYDPLRLSEEEMKTADGLIQAVCW